MQIRMTSLPWDDLRFFLAALEAGSLSAAAERLGVAQATVSRLIAGLEEQIGHVLFDRGREGLVPTDAAAALRPHAEAMASSAEEAAAALSGLEERPAGVVRLAVPPGVATDLVPPLLPILRQRYPDLRLCVLAGNKPVDLVRREADLALRSIRPEQGDLVFRRLPDMPIAAFASRAYVETLPPGAGPADVEWIQYSDDMLHTPMARWVEERRGGRPPAFVSDSFLAMREAARAGVGAMILPEAQGRVAGLVPVPGMAVELPDLSWYLVVHRALRHVPRIQAVVDLIDETVVALLEDRWPLVA